MTEVNCPVCGAVVVDAGPRLYAHLMEIAGRGLCGECARDGYTYTDVGVGV